MSPAPQGGLEVERYIGSCLISQSAYGGPGKQHPPHKGHKKSSGDAASRPFALSPREPPCHGGGGGGGGPPRYAMPPPVHGDHHIYPQHGWAGVPLFCMASSDHRRKARKGPPVGDRAPSKAHHGYPSKDPQDAGRPGDGGCDRSPLSRLAIHTQGAPLIQAGRYSRMGYGRSAPPPLRLYRGGDPVTRRPGSPKAPRTKEPGACDSVSIASDESSANSENSLPRIIKPRKRRKKDRKPTPQQQQQQAAAPDPEPEAPVRPLAHFPAEAAAALLEKADPPPPPPLTAGDELPPGLEQEDGPATTCQCRYCDPAGVIWDVDRRCYSPFLTPPSPTETKPPPPFSFGLRSYDLGPALRRSWSEPSSSAAEAKPQPRTRTVSESPSHGLEVSSEIITSPNGHRDIEIKLFYSAKPGGAGARQLEAEE